MTVQVDIADRLYDYTDEEKAAEAIAEFQVLAGLDDQAILSLWENENDPRRHELERMIYGAVDANGSAKRAEENIPDGISLAISETV
ncbi:hypothetical protein [Asticcacaulis taihuensis]|uniref:Uncharacterized protein n=1 Tax=Asticcacaulis taihuensis TaxID=260084 RepID=A0A1G4SQ57_9CAUL|nr:hypothetical protein [Asticcacaulis taihuensis]SCW71141.1 hypothetical protein SAMN02927928_2806 [Asticcacaulis taihuensis]